MESTMPPNLSRKVAICRIAITNQPKEHHEEHQSYHFKSIKETRQFSIHFRGQLLKEDRYQGNNNRSQINDK
jgi:hypothetical protein